MPSSKVSHKMGAAGVFVPNPEPDIFIDWPWETVPLTLVMDGAAHNEPVKNIVPKHIKDM